MKLKNLLTAAIAAISLSAAAFAQNTAPKTASQSLIDLLPASSAVVTVDVQKGLNDALPKLLVGNPQLKAEVDQGMAAFSTKAGPDALRFSHLVIGVGVEDVAGTAPKILPVFIGRGDIDAEQVVAKATRSSKTPCSERVVSGRTIYICQLEVPVSKAAKAVGTAVNAPDTVLKESAFVVLDANTVAFGAVSRVVEAVEHRTSVDPAITSLLKDSPTTVAAFSMENIDGLGKFIPLENDDLGNTLKNLRFIAGSADSVADGFAFSTLFRNADTASAKQLSSTLQGLQAIGNAFLGGSKRADQRMYARLIKSVKIAQAETDVTVSIALPQADVNALMGQVKFTKK